MGSLFPLLLALGLFSLPLLRNGGAACAAGLEPLSLAAAASEARGRTALPPGDRCAVRNVLGRAGPLETSEAQIPCS